MFQFLLLIFSIKADHRFEQGFVNHFSYVGNTNLVLYLTITQNRYEEFYIPFQTQFASVPNVYLNINKLDFQNIFPQGYSLEFTSITTAGFKVKIVCESTAIFYQVEFNWFAFYDDRVQVINNFNIINPQTQYTHSYQKNCNINMAISNFVSYYALSSQNNILMGLTLTSDTVTISFQFEGLKQFGYQILLSSSDIFLIGPIILSSYPYQSTQIVDFPSGWTIKNCYLNLLGFKHDGFDNIRLLINTTYSSQVTVGIYPWGSSIIQQVQHNYYCLNHAYFELAKFKGFMQSRFFDPNKQMDTHIEIKEINYSQNQIVEEEITFAQSIQSMTIIFYWQCINSEMLKIQIFCIESWCYETKIKCDIKKVNTIRLQAKFLFNQNQQQYIKIAKTAVSLSATQVVKLQNQYQKLLFKLETVS